MSLRDLVTGSDVCTPDDGAGPSNAFAGLANNLLGSSSKDQERLREVRRVYLRSPSPFATLLCCQQTCAVVLTTCSLLTEK